MKSNFEKYLESQRKHLDVEKPDDNLIWEGINHELNKKRIRKSGMIWKAAAIIIFLVSSTYILYNEFYRSGLGIYNITLSEIEPAYAGKVAIYCADFKNKMKLVDAMKPSDVKSLQAFFAELNTLDDMYREYQEDYSNYGYNERLLRAMLDYYDKRVRILDRMLMEIQKQKDYEKRKEGHTAI